MLRLKVTRSWYWCLSFSLKVWSSFFSAFNLLWQTRGTKRKIWIAIFSKRASVWTANFLKKDQNEVSSELCNNMVNMTNELPFPPSDIIEKSVLLGFFKNYFVCKAEYTIKKEKYIKPTYVPCTYGPAAFALPVSAYRSSQGLSSLVWGRTFSLAFCISTLHCLLIYAVRWSPLRVHFQQPAVSFPPETLHVFVVLTKSALNHLSCAAPWLTVAVNYLSQIYWEHCYFLSRDTPWCGSVPQLWWHGPERPSQPLS